MQNRKHKYDKNVDDLIPNGGLFSRVKRQKGKISFFQDLYAYLIVIPWPQGICLIYIPKPKGRRPEGEGIYIRKIPSGHGISNIYHSGMLT